MAKMFEIKGKTATQNAHMAYTAYNRAQAMATECNGIIDFVEGKKIKATFTSNAKAKSFVTAFESEYAEASKAYQATKTNSKPTASKGKTETKTTSTRKPKAHAPKKSKGNSVDFSKFQGTKSEKNRALHATLVGMGIGDSRTKEYQAVWNARPWAK
jgi:hypothetical protein